MTNRAVLILSLTFYLVTASFGQEVANIESIVIESKELNQKREILIYTPQAYNENLYLCYNVIYVFDAQNREFFDYTHSIISFLSNASKQFIVVGITSPYNETLDYARNNDLLPVLQTEDSKNRFGKYSGNADNFMKYVKNEVIPYVDSNYRTLKHRTAVGHSLGASFLIYSMFSAPDIFDNMVAISPNFAIDDERLAKNIENFDFSRLHGPGYLFISSANEADYWQQWKPAKERVYSFLKDSVNTPDLKVVIKEFPEESHWSTFAPALNAALTEFWKATYELQRKELSDTLYEVTIKVTVPHKNDEIYIAGNQEPLGNWQPGQIKLNKTSDFERELKVKLQSPAMFKFTKGNWESEAYVDNAQNDIIVRLKPDQVYKFTLNSFADDPN